MQWLVRSQDKKFIVSIDNVEAVTVNGKHIVRGGGRVLGEYSTEERSIEVITAMMKFIDASEKLIVVGDCEDLDCNLLAKIYHDMKTISLTCGIAPKVIPYRTNHVFEMPKE